jgi:N-acetyl-D-muramate 6-phosphate phosphatase
LPSAIIFDLDGTLLDTEPDFTLLLNRLLLQHGADPVPATVVRRTVSSGARALVKLGFGLQDDDPRLPILLEEFLDMYAEQIPQTTASLFEDIDALIAVLHADGLPWGIMTNKSRRFSAPLLERFESFGSCAALVCPDDVGVGKPDPAGILEVCRQLQLPPAQAIYVGDHPRDIEAAKNAGMPGIAVRWGYLPHDKGIEQWGADFIASNPLHLADYLESLHGHV